MLRVPGWSTAEGTPAPDVRKGGSWGPPLTSQHPSPRLLKQGALKGSTLAFLPRANSHTRSTCVCAGTDQDGSDPWATGRCLG